MTRGSRSTGRKKKTSARRGRPTKRERTTLIVLLAAIAVLLGVLVALLPETAGDDDGALSGTAGSAEPGDAVDDPGDAPVGGTPSDGEPSPTGEGDSASDGRRDDGGSPRVGEEGADGGAVTEAYPDGESPAGDASGGEAPAGTGADEAWWLPESAPPPQERGPLVLVLDDAGNTLDGYQAFLELDVPLAVAVLPQLDHSVRAAAMASAAGKEILLHLPMEAESGADPGPGAIRTDLSAEEVAARVGDDLASVPGAIGVNNHMGSKATADAVLMRTVLGALHDRDLFFLDSRTSAATTGRTVAAEVGIPFAERAVFLDHERTREAILGSLAHALELSGEGEPVVMIGHVTVPLLADVLAEAFPVIVEAGYAFAPLSSLVSPVRVAAGDSE
ncbi:MAG: divergent polysaccharide deacetylase family protein [Spirochaetota bacterium]